MCTHIHQGCGISTPLLCNGMLKRVLLLSVAARGLLTTYCLTSSSLLKLNNLRILLALLGPRRRGIVLSVRPGISCSPEVKILIFEWGNVLKYYTELQIRGELRIIQKYLFLFLNTCCDPSIEPSRYTLWSIIRTVSVRRSNDGS